MPSSKRLNLEGFIFMFFVHKKHILYESALPCKCFWGGLHVNVKVTIIYIEGRNLKPQQPKYQKQLKVKYDFNDYIMRNQDKSTCISLNAVLLILKDEKVPVWTKKQHPALQMGYSTTKTESSKLLPFH